MRNLINKIREFFREMKEFLVALNSLSDSELEAIDKMMKDLSKNKIYGKEYRKSVLDKLRLTQQ